MAIQIHDTAGGAAADAGVAVVLAIVDAIPTDADFAVTPPAGTVVLYDAGATLQLYGKSTLGVWESVSTPA